ncbi:MAG: RNA methyltransferase [Bacteroidetes bacterium]|nr:RNA methyltransferase [Bacteroidota bacterium]
MQSLPSEFIESLINNIGFDKHKFQQIHTESLPICSVRLNKLKAAPLSFKLNTPVPWCNNAFYLDSRPLFTADPLFHAGAYYVQEAGSMFIEQAIRQNIDLNATLQVLDLCAAPGGKSTLLASLINEHSLLVANELVKNRCHVLIDNLNKWGNNNCIVTNSQPEKFSALHNFFDIVLVDAPCSGSGLFRKQPEAIEHWSLNAVNQCSIRQKSILKNAMQSLKKGGLLIYSTCSYSEEENEAISKWLINEGLIYKPITIDANWGIVDTGYGYKFYPYNTQAEGFFCAAFCKEGDLEKTSLPTLKNKFALSKELKNFIETFDFVTTAINETIHITNQASLLFYTQYFKHFYFKKLGISVGELKGKDFIPNHQLALSALPISKFEQIQLTKEQALNYLKKESLTLSPLKKNMYLATFNGLGLGWIKQLDNRSNNYLPQHLKIRMDIPVLED